MENAKLLQEQLDGVLGNFPLKKPLVWSSSICCGFLMCAVAYELARKYSPVLFPNTYGKLSEKDKVEWNNRAISLTHGIISTVVAACILAFTDLFRDDAPYGPVMFRSTIFTVFFLGVSNGYFITDLAMILKYYPSLGGWLFVVHHLISIISLVLAVYSGYAHVYLYTVYLTEVTTPSINIRWYLAVADMKKSKAYLYNGVFMFFSWMIFRIALFLYVFTHMYFHYDQMKELNFMNFYFVFISCGGFAVMNLYWFSKIARGLVKTMKAKES